MPSPHVTIVATRTLHPASAKRAGDARDETNAVARRDLDAEVAVDGFDRRPARRCGPAWARTASRGAGGRPVFVRARTRAARRGSAPALRRRSWPRTLPPCGARPRWPRPAPSAPDGRVAPSTSSLSSSNRSRSHSSPTNVARVSTHNARACSALPRCTASWRTDSSLRPSTRCDAAASKPTSFTSPATDCSTGVPRSSRCTVRRATTTGSTGTSSHASSTSAATISASDDAGPPAVASASRTAITRERRSPASGIEIQAAAQSGARARRRARAGRAATRPTPSAVAMTAPRPPRADARTRRGHASSHGPRPGRGTHRATPAARRSARASRQGAPRPARPRALVTASARPRSRRAPASRRRRARPTSLRRSRAWRAAPARMRRSRHRKAGGVSTVVSSTTRMSAP